MKVAINALAQTPGYSSGALSQYLQMAKYLPLQGRNLDYVFLSGSDDAGYYSERLPIPVSGVGVGNRRRILRVLSEHLLVGLAMRRTGAGVLFSGGAGVAPLFLPRDARLVLAVWAMHHLGAAEISLKQRLYRALFFKRSVRRADICVVNSEYSRRILLEHCPDIKAEIRVVHHGVDATLFHAEPLSPVERARSEELTGGEPYVLYVGQVYPYKLLHILVEAFAKSVASARLPHKLVIVGSFAEEHGMGRSYLERIQDIMGRHGLADRLMTLSDIPVKDLRLLYAGADLYVQSSRAETFGRTVIEAMACGCPVLAADAAATPEVLGGAGRYYQPDDVNQCAKEIEYLLSDSEARAALRSAGLERVKQFSFSNEMALMADAFRKAADMSPAARGRAP